MPKKEHNLVHRAPVIVVMGHVDHGKSALLDYIRKTNIVANEAGGITQRISAYEVEHTDREGHTRTITFLDTPGHESFSKMRARGSVAADIAILVVSAEEGVKPQTLEAYESIKKSGIPFIVAINKIDKPGADIERTKITLLEAGLYLEGMGGDIPFVPISAKTGEKVSELLDMMLLVADLSELKGDREKLAEGVVIESNRDAKKGISATLLIKDGTLRKGMYVQAGASVAPVRIMEDFAGLNISEASFSSPILLVGFDSLPSAGEQFRAYETKKEAESAARAHAAAIKENHKDILYAVDEDSHVIPIILRADVIGSLEAIEHEINKLKSDGVEVRLIQKNVGPISEGDIKLALASNQAIILGFNVPIDNVARDFALRNDITIQIFDIIYKLAEWLQEEVHKRTPKKDTEESTGKAVILKIFGKTKDKQVIGGRVESGVLKVGSTVQIVRKDNRVGTGTILNLQQQKADAKSVESGEFGAQIASRIDISPKDTLESFIIVKK